MDGGIVIISMYFKNIKMQETKSKLSLVFEEINIFVYSILPNLFSCLPKGGSDYIEMINQYDITC